MKYALISVSDKRGITEFAASLKNLDYTILATGRTAKMIKEAGTPCTEISDFTSSPEVFEGRVKTLHPKVFGGILFRRDNEQDKKEAAENNIEAIDIVCCNLYPFAEVAKKEGASLDELIENIDIGGPSLIRAAAKNNMYTAVLTNPEQYDDFLKELEAGEVSVKTRRGLALAAYRHTADYDALISNVLGERFEAEEDAVRIHSRLTTTLRYGENPHQGAAVYGDFFAYFESIHGKELSYNNILDLIAAVELAEDLGENACAIIKHNNPSGAAIAENQYEAYVRALSCDPVSAFGGIVALNDTVDENLAAKLNEHFLEVISAPGYTEEALALLRKKRDRRLIVQKQKITKAGRQFRSIPGGVLVQDADIITDDFDNLKTATKREPTEQEMKDLKFAWTVCKHVKSNTIVFVKDQMTVGVGAGQVSRIDSAKIAAIKAEEFKFDLKGSVAASDAFFPFPDGLLEIVSRGATAVIQPGGSKRDDQVIEAADEHNTAMVFTGKRHFKH